MRVAFFGYSWSPTGKLDHYTSELVQALSRVGLEVDVYLSNHFAERLGIKGFSSRVSLSRLAAGVRSARYDFALSINNGLLMPEVVDALSCRPVSVIVDGLHHLFDHTDSNHRQVFELDAVFAPIFTAIEPDIRAICATADVRFMPPATSFATDGPESSAAACLDKASNKGPDPISWVASLVGDHVLDGTLRALFSNREFFTDLLAVLDLIEVKGHVGREEPLREAAEVLAKQLAWDWDYFEMQMQNVVTNNQRLETVDRLGGLGLALYGNERWTRLLPDSRAVARCLRSGAVIGSHADLKRIYDNSLLSINLPQIHVATAMQYRVVDIMASRSLLLTKHHPESDLYRVFGRDSQIPVYRSIDDLEKVCRHFLANGDERRALSSHCNELTASGFSFEDRALEYLELSNPEAARVLQPRNGQPSPITVRQADEFTNWVRAVA